MRLRLLVVAAFVAMAAVPVWLAWDTGVLPGPSQASAESTGVLTTSSAAVASLAWPKEPLGLAANDTRIYWEQRDPAPAVAGLWYYDVAARAGRPAARAPGHRQGLRRPLRRPATSSCGPPGPADAARAHRPSRPTTA